MAVGSHGPDQVELGQIFLNVGMFNEMIGAFVGMPVRGRQFATLLRLLLSLGLGDQQREARSVTHLDMIQFGLLSS